MFRHVADLFINFMAWLKSELKKKKTPTAHPIQRKSNDFFWAKEKRWNLPNKKKRIPGFPQNSATKIRKKKI